MDEYKRTNAHRMIKARQNNGSNGNSNGNASRRLAYRPAVLLVCYHRVGPINSTELGFS
ncbi:hypothetical protein AX15_001016 [Amanita polypyramis BW_CC]|nr:hypothetical protein AX15_001016 [Amanita polypyramis BW_CC]